MSSALKQGIQAQLEKHSLVEPQWNWAVVFDTTWTGPLPPGSEWDYDMFIARSAAEEQLHQPLTGRFRDPELWQRRNGTWEEAPENQVADTRGRLSSMSDRETSTGYEDQAAAFIAGAERYAALGLPGLPDDPAEAAAMRAAGYEVLAEVREVDWPVAIVSVAGEDEEARHAVSAEDVAAALRGPDAFDLAGRQFIATYRETPETGPVLSAFRPVPGPEAAAESREMMVRCLLLAGDQAELVGDDSDDGDVARWPAAAIAGDTGLPLEDLPGRVFRARVTELDSRVLFSGFTLPS